MCIAFWYGTKWLRRQQRVGNNLERKSRRSGEIQALRLVHIHFENNNGGAGGNGGNGGVSSAGGGNAEGGRVISSR